MDVAVRPLDCTEYSYCKGSTPPPMAGVQARPTYRTSAPKPLSGFRYKQRIVLLELRT